MPLFLVAIHRPNDYDPAKAEDKAMAQAIDDLNDEMQEAGARVFAGGLHPIHTAQSLLLEESGQVTLKSGPFLQADEHVGGFWLLNAATQAEALEWGRKAAITCRASVEVRQFH